MTNTVDLDQVAHSLAQVARQLGDALTAARVEDPRRVYTLPEVAALTGWALSTLEEDCRLGRIRFVRKGKAYGLTAKQFDALIEQHTVHGDIGQRLAAVVATASPVQPGNRRSPGRRVA